MLPLTSELLEGQIDKFIAICAARQDHTAGHSIFDLQPVPHPRMDLKPAVNMIMLLRKVELRIAVRLRKNRNSIYPAIFPQADAGAGHLVCMPNPSKR